MLVYIRLLLCYYGRRA